MTPDDEIGQLLLESLSSNDSARNNRLVHFLRREDSAVVYESVQKLLSSRSPNAFEIARRLITNKVDVRRIFWSGLSIADASSIEHWLAFAIPKLGVRSVIEILKQKEDDVPGTIGKARYFLPKFLKNDENGLLAKLKDA